MITKKDRELLLLFLHWMNDKMYSNPMILETDSDDIVDMFLYNTYGYEDI